MPSSPLFYFTRYYFSLPLPHFFPFLPSFLPLSPPTELRKAETRKQQLAHALAESERESRRQAEEDAEGRRGERDRAVTCDTGCRTRCFRQTVNYSLSSSYSSSEYSIMQCSIIIVRVSYLHNILLCWILIVHNIISTIVIDIPTITTLLGMEEEVKGGGSGAAHGSGQGGRGKGAVRGGLSGAPWSRGRAALYAEVS